MGRQLNSRMTCYALISCIEEDLRSIVRSYGQDLSITDLLPHDVREEALKRRRRDDRVNEYATDEADDFDLLTYIDFLDLSKILNSKLSQHSQSLGLDTKALSTRIVSLGPTRNRVCHTRPLEIEDVTRCLDTSDELLDLFRSVFVSLGHTRERMAQGSLHGLVEQIPRYWNVGDVENNLPLPDFEETSFLGRIDEKRKVKKLLKGAIPIVTIVGEGGVGKTALALSCLYDLMDDAATPYDAILWISLKTTSLTGDGVRAIRDSIGTAFELHVEMAHALGTPSASKLMVDDLVEEIAEYLSTYKTLIAIDNLETIEGKHMYALCEAVSDNSNGSKLLLTSRCGLGNYEYRYQLGDLDIDTAVALIQRFASLLEVSAITNQNKRVLATYCTVLFRNPLLIKWFVSAVSKGASVSSLLSKQGASFKGALAFCFANILDNLDDTQRAIVDILAAAKRPVSDAELKYLWNESIGADDVDAALSWLRNSSIVRYEAAKGVHHLVLSAPASHYVNTTKPPSQDELSRVRERLGQLQSVSERESVKQERNPWDARYVHDIKTNDQKVAAMRLANALKYIFRERDYVLARKEIEECKRLVYDYSEVYRISALVEERAGDDYAAKNEYEEALEHDPESEIARFQFAMFLSRKIRDQPEAIRHLDVLLQRRSNDRDVQVVKAGALKYAGRYSEALALYEDLLACRGDAPEKHARRLYAIASDQAADCYRRAAERDGDNADKENAQHHLRRGLEILSDSIKAGDSDGRTPFSIGKLFSEAVRCAARLDDEEMVEDVFEQLEEMAEQLKSGGMLSFEPKDDSWIVARVNQAPKWRERLQKLLTTGDQENAKKSKDIKKAHTDWENLERRNVPDSLSIGQVVTGMVKNVDQSYGVFVNLGECDGLLHRSKMPLERTQLPSALFKVGDEVEVIVVKIDHERNLVSLASQEAYPQRRNLERRKVPDNLSVGQVVTGMVKNVDQPYGVFVNLGECDGLLHRSKMPLERTQLPSALFKVGDEVEVIVLTIDRNGDKVSLGYREVIS